MSKTTKEDSKQHLDVTEQGGSKSPILSPKISTHKTTPVEMDLSILFKFINSYDGSRDTLNSFIVNCNNVYELATEIQKPIVFKYILSQLRGKAEVACSIKEFNNWEQLKEFLKNQFGVRKHYSHLLTELQDSKQGPQDSVSEFALRIETSLSQLLTEISISTSKLKELPGRSAAMEDLALHHFVIGLNPRISAIVRCRSPKTLNEAINFAISEEKIQQSIYKKNPMSNENRVSRFKINTSQARRFSDQTQVRNNIFPKTPVVANTIVCRYCKFPGHSIENCKKREYNNRARNFDRPSTSGFRPQQQHVHFIQDPENRDESDPHCYDDNTKNE